MKRKISVLISVIILSTVTLTTVPALATQSEIIYENTTEIQPRTDIKEWRFKIENGNLYKRLYNYTRNRWETDWIFVMSGVTEL